MILFYSDYCPHCRMLKETINNYDKDNKLIKLVSVDVMRKKGQPIPSSIKSVPALLILPSKNLLFGKDVFDYLLLPESGILLRIKAENLSPNKKEKENEKENDDNIVSFSFGGSSGFSDNYALIDDSTNNDDGFKESNYVWASITEESQEPLDTALPISEKTKVKKQTLDFEDFKKRRELELRQNDINKKEVSPPIRTR